MARAPQTPVEIFDDIAKDYQKIFAADLISIILYGSGARGDYTPGKSDINFMIVLTESGIGSLGKAIPLVAGWHKRRVSTPLFLTKSYIESSLDTFPVEFLNFKTNYRLVYGTDVLKDLTFDKKFLRLQCERELKGKLLQLRENFLDTGGKPGGVENLIAASLSTFFSVFQAILFFRGKAPVSGQSLLLAEMASEADIHRELFLDLIAVKAGKKKLKPGETVSLMERYIEEIRKLAARVDGWEEV